MYKAKFMKTVTLQIIKKEQSRPTINNCLIRGGPFDTHHVKFLRCHHIYVNIYLDMIFNKESYCVEYMYVEQNC